MEVSRTEKNSSSLMENRQETKAGLDMQQAANRLPGEKPHAGQADSKSTTAAVRQILALMEIPFSKESAAAAELAIQVNQKPSKKTMQTAVQLLKKYEFKEGTAVLRFMLQNQLPVSEAVFQSLMTARESTSLTSQLQMLQAALKQSGELPQNQFKALKQLLETSADFLEAKPPPAFWKAKLQLFGVDDEAQIARHTFDLAARSVKQELLQLFSQTVPAPIRQLAEQAVGKLNAQHILSAESGAMQQVVMQIPVCLPFFQGDVTMKWEGKKKSNGQIDEDFCRVFFWLQMPNLGSTTVDMQVQNRIVHLTIASEKSSSQFKKFSEGPAQFLKQALEESGYFFSGLTYNAFTSDKQTAQLPEPLAQIMDEKRQMEVDIRI